MTIGNSSPFALWTVIMRTPSLPSSRIGASPACAVSAATRSSSTKPRNESPPPPRTRARARPRAARWRAPARRRCAARSRRARASRRAAPGSSRRPGGSCGADAAAAGVRRLSAIGCEVRRRGRASGIRNGWKTEEALLPLQQLLVADREQRAAQRREHRQLIVRPLDRGQRRAERFDFLAIVEGLAADEHVTHAAGLERPHVRLRSRPRRS